MQTILLALSFLPMLVSFDLAGFGLKKAVDRVLESFPKKLEHSSDVPFWRYGEFKPFTCQQPGYFPDVENCKYYYQCVKFLPGHLMRYVYQCDDDRVYSVQENSCITADATDGSICAGNVGNRPTERPTHEEQDQDDGSSNPPTNSIGQDTTTEHVKQSSKLDLENATETTVSNKFVDSSTNRTRFDENAAGGSNVRKCNEYTDTGISNVDPNRRWLECVREGFFVNPEDCSKFYRCVAFMHEFVKYEFVCPRGTIWDERLETCNFPGAVWRRNCKYRYASSSVEQKIDDSLDNANGRLKFVCPTGFRQHSNYCNSFYQCTGNDSSEYRVTIFACPKGSFFDRRNVRCTAQQSIRNDSCVNLELQEEQNSSRILDLSEDTACQKEGRFPYNDTYTDGYLECKRDEFGTLETYLLDCPPGQLYSQTTNECVANSEEKEDSEPIGEVTDITII